MKKLDPCSACLGKGRVQHPDWAAYYLAVFDKQLPGNDLQACIEFFIQHGHKTLPPTTISCTACHTTGVQQIELVNRF